MNPSNLAQNMYQKTAAQTASPEKLLLMLYDGAIKHTKAALKGLHDCRNEDAHVHLLKVQEILEELIISLNMDYEISKHLRSLYEYFISKLVEANVSKDTAGVELVLDFLSELRETWAQAAQQVARVARYGG